MPYQADLYSRVFDNLYLIVGSRHVDKINELIPTWWGIIVATSGKEEILLTTDRKAQPNPSPDPYLVAQLLWKEEAVAVLADCGLDKGWRSKRVKLIHERLASELPFRELKDRVRFMLKRRVDWLKANSIVSAPHAG